VKRRKESRLKPSIRQPVILTVLDAKRTYVMEAYLLDISSGGLRLRLPQPLPCGTPVKVDVNNTGMLGEVCRCEPEAGAYMVRVQASQTSSSLMKLERLERALMSEAEGNVESDSEPRFSSR